jgi:hypothetical protein
MLFHIHCSDFHKESQFQEDCIAVLSQSRSVLAQFRKTNRQGRQVLIFFLARFVGSLVPPALAGVAARSSF